MKRLTLARHILTITAISLSSIMAIQCSKNEFTLARDVTFSSLTGIRQAKENQLNGYFGLLLEKALNARSDTVLTSLFSYKAASLKNTAIPSDFQERLDLHFVENYGEFYDLLWIDTSGLVFNSVRQESDYQTNLFEDWPNSQLSIALQQADKPTFVDYEFYAPSAEPGAFQIIPLFAREQLAGWLVFQLSINRINSILTDRSRMGKTGEVYLVSSSGLMLSLSRFAKETTILKKIIDTEPLRAAARAKEGNLLTTDYRGIPVYSSFSQINVFGITWYIVAEIDEAEVITSHFYKHSNAMRSPLLNLLKLADQSSPRETPPPLTTLARVDMNEYGTASPGEILKTSGVATCTAVAITFPGRFAYLAHISPADMSYKSESLELFGVPQETDLLPRLLEQIRRYDIYPYEASCMQFVIVAVHDESCWNIIDQLIEAGYFLNQIKLLYKPDALYANVTVMADTNAVQVDWFSSERSRPTKQSSELISDIGKLVDTLFIR